MRQLLAACAMCVAAISQASDWSTVTASAAERSSVELATSSGKTTFIWQPRIIPGSDLLLTTAKFTGSGTTFYSRYIFKGVNGGSATIRFGVASGPSNKIDPGSEQEIFVELAGDGSFHLVPEDLRGIGFLRVQRDSEDPAYYDVSLIHGAK